MTADEMVEKVARAICEEMEGTPDLWGRWIPEARAAIRAVYEAMREPSAAMHKACQATTGAIITRQHCKEMWQGMLAAHPIAEAARDE